MIKCLNSCCDLIYEDFKGTIDYVRDKEKYNKMKGGGVLHDTKTNRILLIQSRGKLWGLPKGTKENNETIENCAIREIFEETGIKVSETDFKFLVKINNNRSHFYYITNVSEKIEKIQSQLLNNDATGIGWIKINCLNLLIKEDKLRLNRQSKIVLNKIFTDFRL